MEQGASNTVNTPVTNASTSQASSPVEANPPAKDDAVFTNKPKKNKGMILEMVLLGLLAVGGIGFGVWAMIDGNAQKEQLNSQISALKEQNDKLAGKMGSVSGIKEEEVEDVVVRKNPIVKSPNSEEKFRVHFNSSRYFTGKDGEFETLHIAIEEGKVVQCEIYASSTGQNLVDGGGKYVSDCNITGISGEIFDVIEFGQGHDNSNSNIGFIMTDGTIQYFSFIESMESKTFAVKGTLGIDGFIVDSFEVSVSTGSPIGGYGSTAFILSDGSVVKFDESMLK